jgi:hypothetical protein
MKHFKSVLVAGTVCLAVWTGTAIANEIAATDNVTLTDFSGIGASDQIPLLEILSGGGFGDFVVLGSLNQDSTSWAGKMAKFSVNVNSLLAALAGAALPSNDKTRVTNSNAYVIANAQAAPALAGGYSPALIASTAGELVNDGEKLNEMLDKMIDDKNRIDPLLVGPSGKQSISVVGDLGKFVKELQKVPDTKLKGKVATTMDAVADGTDDLLASLEKIVPILAKLGKKINASVN